MDSAYCAALVVQAQACVARVEGMKAENQNRLDCGHSLAYGEEAFDREAQTLEYIASALFARAGV